MARIPEGKYIANPEMNIAQAFSNLSTCLSELYADPGEGKSVARIVFEDALRIFPPFTSKSALLPEQLTRYNEVLEQLLGGAPIQYILGEADFYGYKFTVTPAVLIPRPETEELVYAAVKWLLAARDFMDTPRVLDVGTGSGCIAVTVKKKCPWINCMAIDRSLSALGVARGNALRHQVEVNFEAMDFLEERSWAQLPEFDLILSNPPYIPEGESRDLATRVRDYEPQMALFVPDEDPLQFYRALSAFASRKLSPEGALMAECHPDFARDAEALWIADGWKEVRLEKDLSGRDRLLRAEKTFHH